MSRWSSLWILKLAGLSVTTGLLISCSVDTPSQQYNMQRKELATDESREFVYAQWLDTVLAHYYNVTPDKLDDEFNNRSSQYYKDILQIFQLWQHHMLSLDGKFWITQRLAWEQRGFSSLSRETANIHTFFGMPLNDVEFSIIWHAGVTTNIANTLKELLLISKYFQTAPKSYAEDPIVHESLAKLLDPEASDYNLVAYALENNPILEWVYSSSDPVDAASAPLIQVRNVKAFNSLFTPGTDDALQVDVLNISPLTNELAPKGFKGVRFLRYGGTGALANDIEYYSTVSEHRSGFLQDNNTIVSPNAIGSASLFNNAILLPVALASDVEPERVDASRLFFDINKRNSYMDPKSHLRYDVVSAIPTDESHISFIVRIADTHAVNNYTYYTGVFVRENGAWVVSVPPSMGSIPEYVVPKSSSYNNNDVELKYVLRIMPLLTTTSATRRLTFATTIFNNPTAVNKLAILFATQDNNLIKRVKRFYLKQGYNLEARSPLVEDLVKALDLENN